MSEHSEKRICILSDLRHCNIIDTLNEILFCLQDPHM